MNESSFGTVELLGDFEFMVRFESGFEILVEPGFQLIQTIAISLRRLTRMESYWARVHSRYVHHESRWKREGVGVRTWEIMEEIDGKKVVRIEEIAI